MPIKLSDLQKATKNVVVKFYGDELNVEYKINVVTPAFLEEKPKLTEQLARVIEHWDLVDENGDELPHDVKMMEKLPVQLHTKLMNSIITDMNLAGEDQKKD